MTELQPLTSSRRRDEGRFCDQQCSGSLCALSVVLGVDVMNDMLRVGAHAGEGSHDQTVLQFHLAYFQRLEQGRVIDRC